MSLTNPNKPVTEARLQEFYHRIKNYLGFTEMPSEDMAEIVTPKPSARARYQKYSTEEQIVGEWIDGKPIYQKSFVVTSNFEDRFTIDANLDSLVDIKCYRLTSTGSKSMYPYVPYTDTMENYVKYSFTGFVSSTQYVPQIGSTILSTILKAVYTFQYTKTTD